MSSYRIDEQPLEPSSDYKLVCPECHTTIILRPDPRVLEAAIEKALYIEHNVAADIAAGEMAAVLRNVHKSRGV